MAWARIGLSGEISGNVESHFFDHIHPQVDVGLIADGITAAEDGEAPDIMTIHGCRHITDLVESLDEIASSISMKRGVMSFSPLEAYILLCAAHLHDAGNIGGRRGHPERCGEMIRNHADLFYDTETRQNVFNVARVHGGTGRFGQDTFREISSDNFTPPRLRLLAAMLRLADELSENPERVPNELVKRWQASPRSNLAYRYAQCFARFDLQNDVLRILLLVQPEQHGFVTEIEGNQVGFFDHLEEKIDVIEKEARYCSQYGRPDFNVTRIQFTVEYFAGSIPSTPEHISTLSLELDRGYPGDLPALSKRCDDLSDGRSLAEFCRG